MYNYEHGRDKNNIFVAKTEKELSDKKHFHNCIEFIYIIDGEAIAHIDDIEHKLSSGQMCAVSCFSPHYYETIRSGQYTVCLIPRRYFREYDAIFNANSFKNPVIDDGAAKPLFSIFRMLENICSNCNIFGSETDNFTEKTKNEQLHHLSAFLVNLCINHCSLYERHRISALVADAVNIIENDYKNDLSIETICKKLGCYQKNLSFNFKKTMGMSILNYIERTRVFEAERLLCKYPQMTIETVMMESGFNSSRSFLRHFRAVFGCTPTEYKNKHKNN